MVHIKNILFKICLFFCKRLIDENSLIFVMKIDKNLPKNKWVNVYCYAGKIIIRNQIDIQVKIKEPEK